MPQPLLPRDNPGGVDADAIEETITARERLVYRQLVTSLLTRGYIPSLELAETAYTMLQIRRIRAAIEDDRTASSASGMSGNAWPWPGARPTPDPAVIDIAQHAYDASVKYDQRETASRPGRP